MNKRTKVAIFLAAVLLSLAWFNLVVTPSALDILTLSKAQSPHVEVTVTASLHSNAQPVVRINGLP
jgi:predicted amidohydrolase